MKAKIVRILIAMALCVLMVFISACGSSEKSSETSSSSQNSSSQSSESKNDLKQSLDSIKEAANDLKEAANDVKDGLSGAAEAVEDVLPTSASYEDIYETYAEKIREATPGLIDEYKEEAASNNAGLEGLAEIANNKVEKLAEISNQGVEKMAGHMMVAGSGKYDEYEEWAGKLYEVYEEEASKIYDVYMNSAMG